MQLIPRAGHGRAVAAAGSSTVAATTTVENPDHDHYRVFELRAGNAEDCLFWLSGLSR